MNRLYKDLVFCVAKFVSLKKAPKYRLINKQWKRAIESQDEIWTAWLTHHLIWTCNVFNHSTVVPNAFEWVKKYLSAGYIEYRQWYLKNNRYRYRTRYASKIKRQCLAKMHEIASSRSMNDFKNNLEAFKKKMLL